MTTSGIITSLQAGEITTTQAYNLLINDLVTDCIDKVRIFSGEELYLIRYFRGKIEEILDAVKGRRC